jgi:membrane-associated phospholipid phosphatase
VTTRRQAQLYAAGLAFASAVLAALSAAVLFWGTADEADVRFVRWAHAAVPEALVDVANVLTYLGSVAILGPVAIVAALLLVNSGRPGAAVFVLTSFAAGELLSQGLKSLFRRARPELDDPFVQLTTYAFPSGHAFGATATYGALALVLASATTDRRRRLAVLIAAAVLVAVVAATRVVLGRHYLLDVLAGIAGGIALLCLLLLVFQRARRRFFRVVVFSGQEQPQRPRLDP